MTDIVGETKSLKLPNPCDINKFQEWLCEKRAIGLATLRSKIQDILRARKAIIISESHGGGFTESVSGGSDSMALCVLAADGKKAGLSSATKNSKELIDGMLAIIVDHGLRAESETEANLVQRRVLNMGIMCEIVRADWENGKPKQGHVQEAARAVRYQQFQRICNQYQMNVLLLAHHADDQAELFILRLSRNSGVLGLAGIAFTSQVFNTNLNSSIGGANNILLVRPFLEFMKDDMYKAELFILRLSRNSGVLGLAGMAFTSQVFNTNLNSSVGGANNMVRQFLEFTKDDMYKVITFHGP
ncbi:hypothetical protein AgCh_028581 [Apium graveolens]